MKLQSEKLEGIHNILSRCRKGDRKAQKELYDHFAPLYKSICMRYMKDIHKAEDMMVQGFFKIFKNINQYTGKGNFQGWMRRIMVNECLMNLRQKNNFNLSIEVSHVEKVEQITVEDRLIYEDLLKLLKLLPTGYRTVLNLYVIEGYKHREIAEQLGISINTSKSQLILAKKRMRELIKKKHISIAN